MYKITLFFFFFKNILNPEESLVLLGMKPLLAFCASMELDILKL